MNKHAYMPAHMHIYTNIFTHVHKYIYNTYIVCMLISMYDTCVDHAGMIVEVLQFDCGFIGHLL